MKFICSQSDLKSALSLVSGAIPARPTHPVLANVLIVAESDSDSVVISGFDLSLGIKTRINAYIENAGVVTIPAKLFSDIVSRLPDGQLTLDCIEDDNDVLLDIQSQSGNFKIRGLRAGEYPELPEIKGELINFDKFILLEGIKATTFASSNDETKQILTGVNIQVKQNELKFAATNGHRLSVISLPSTIEQELELTISSKSLKEIEKLITADKDNDTITLQIEEEQINVEIGSHQLFCRKLAGTYPAYHQLIPTEFKRKIVCDRRSLINAVELVSVFTDSKNNVCKTKLDAENNQLLISVDAREIGNGQQTVSAEITGEELNIGFNSKYLIDGLKAVSSDEVQIQLNESGQPVILSPFSHGTNFIYLIMPVQLREYE